MHKKFEINRKKIKGGCQSERKVVTHKSKSDLPLVICDFYKWKHLKPDNVWVYIFFRLVNAKNLIDLLKSYGPNEESLLMTFCCQKNDSAFLRAQIFAFLSRVLVEANGEAIEMIIKKNHLGLSALDYATMANNAKVASFLAKLFYIFGEDVLGKDTQVSYTWYEL